MFKVSHSTRSFRRNASIIPVTQIIRSCHLLPTWGKRVDPMWTSKNVLDKCTHFFVNPYLRHHNFVLFKYLQELRSTQPQYMHVFDIPYVRNDKTPVCS